MNHRTGICAAFSYTAELVCSAKVAEHMTSHIDYIALCPCALFLFCAGLNAEHSGTLGVATEEPRKGCPAAADRVLMRLVKGLFTLSF